ncbi:DRTGG domain-containing protein [Chitinispirillum alkaliphilum]|nr:DRTGG domain-containing protein [Chitinispirillum alkaliphilum]
MTPEQLQSQLDLESIQPAHRAQTVSTGYTSDLLSDVMANAQEDSVLITIQAHVNTIAVASLAGIPAIIVCNSRPVPEDMIEAAQKENIAIYRSQENQYTVSHRVYQALNRSS